MLLAWALVYWGVAQQSRPMLDAMTYGALAKHVNTSGDWATLHYASQAYSDFFQHPPLAVWLQAWVFRALGASDLTIRILPTFVALLIFFGVYQWGRRWAGAWVGWVSVGVLFTSTRFVKYTLQFYLDSFLALFVLISAFLIQLWVLDRQKPQQRKDLALGGGAGAALGLAFLSKGIPAAVLLPVMGAVVLERGILRRQWASSFRFLLAITLGLGWVLAPWLWALDGLEFLKRYWQESVSGRVSARDLSSWLAPSVNLLKQYWPWLIVLPWALIQVFRRAAGTGRWSENGIPAALAVGIFLGFSSAGLFLEHYLVPFYPFAALVIGREIASRIEAYRAQIAAGVSLVLVIYWGFLLSGSEVQGTAYRDPFRNILAAGNKLCPGMKLVLVSSELADLWTGLATALWYTDADARVEDGPLEKQPAVLPAGALISRARWQAFRVAERPRGSTWMMLTQDGDFVFAGFGCQAVR